MRKFLDFLAKRKQTAEDVAKAATVKRAQIMSDGATMKRLMSSQDFIRFTELLIEDKEALVANILAEDPKAVRDQAQYVRLVARINQIDKILGKPKSMIWQMENLTEVRTALQEQTHVRQAHGNQTGGNNGN